MKGKRYQKGTRYQVPFLLRRAREWAEFFGGGVLSVAFICAIIITTGPQYIGILHKLFRI